MWNWSLPVSLWMEIHHDRQELHCQEHIENILQIRIKINA